ncbi:MAG: glycosyltransferase [Patescibacteria group bacterium]
MKVCIINNLYPPYTRGGAEQVVVKTVEGLLLAGHTVVVITTAPKTTFSSPYEGEVRRGSNMPVIYRFTPRNLFFYTDAHQHNFFARLVWHSIDIFHISSMRYVEEILKKEKPDVVHTHNLMGMSFLIPRMIRRLGIRHVHTVHDVQLVEPSGIIRKSKEKTWRYQGFHVQLYSWAMKTLMGSPNVVISPSQFLLHFYEFRGFFPNSKRVVLRNPVTVEVANLPRIPHDGIHFLYLGQIEEHKGIIFLVKTFLGFLNKSKVNKIPSPREPVPSDSREGGQGRVSTPVNTLVFLHIAGTGSELEHVKQLANNNPNIILHGKVDHNTLPQLFATTDVTIVPSLCYENSPTVIFESFSFGVPVLASNVEGIAELIRERENGLTFATEDQASLMNKLQWCIEHRHELNVMGDKTTRSLTGLSVGEYIKQLLIWYDARATLPT